MFWHLQGQLVSMWQDLSQSELSLNQQLSEFYDTLLSTWHSQLQWSSQVSYTTLKDKHLSVSSRCCMEEQLRNGWMDKLKCGSEYFLSAL